MADRWLDINREGLRQILADRSPTFVLTEPIQNSLDEKGVTKIEVDFRHLGRNRCGLNVSDDSPEGFRDLTDAFTMFQPSSKKGDPTKRGFFNQGEKLVLAMCYSAVVSTTKGTVQFLEDGTRHVGRTKRKFGSQVSFDLRMNLEQYEEACKVVPMLHIPGHIEFYFNGQRIVSKQPLHTFAATLPTRLEKPDGEMGKTSRKTTIEVYDAGGETAGWIYEMGIPVVATGDKYHYDVQQKVLLNSERDNVTPGYLQLVRTLVFNEMSQKLEKDDFNQEWVRAATSDPNVKKESFQRALDQRFGEQRAMYSPSDPESAKTAMERGYTVVTGGSMSAGEHENNRRFGTTTPAAQLFPTPKPYSKDGDPEKIIPHDQQPKWMQFAVRHCKHMAKLLMGVDIRVDVVDWPPTNQFAACYGHRRLALNLRSFKSSNTRYLDYDNPVLFDKALDDLHDTMLHEFGHEYSPDHKCEPYYTALAKLGAQLARYCLAEPRHFSLDYVQRSEITS